MGRPRENGELLALQVGFDHLRRVYRGPVLLEDDPARPLKVEVNGLHELIFQDASGRSQHPGLQGESRRTQHLVRSGTPKPAALTPQTW